MLLIPDDILTLYEAVLRKRAVPYSNHLEYKKWLRYYLDFCGKYPLPDSRSERVKLFINKLQKKTIVSELAKKSDGFDCYTAFFNSSILA